MASEFYSQTWETIWRYNVTMTTLNYIFSLKEKYQSEWDHHAADSELLPPYLKLLVFLQSPTK